MKVIAWLTDQTPGDFTVEYAVVGGTPKTAVPISLDGVEFDRVRITRGR